MALSLLVDPAVPAFMGVLTSHEGVGNAIRLLNDINRLTARFECVRLIGDSEFELTLFESGCFPFYDSLVLLLRESGWGDVYDPPTVLALVNGVVQKMTSISNFTTADFVLLQSSSLVPPDVHLAEFPRLKAALHELLAFYCTAELEGKAWVSQSSAALSSAFAPSQHAQFNCQVALVEPAIANPPVESFTSVQQIPRLQSLADLYGCLLAQHQWDVAENDAELELAIAARAYQLRAASGVDGTEFVDRFAVGAHFASSLGGAQAWKAGPYSSATLETCARICGGLPQPDDNPFLTSPASGVQRRRSTDGALAHRVHVSKHGPGIRLMYWRKPTGAVDLSNVSVKDDIVIYE